MRFIEHPMKHRMYTWQCSICQFWTYDEEEAMVHETGIP